MADHPTSAPHRHLVAVPYPGRGHMNPMINLCKLIASRRPPGLHIHVIVTEEWLGYLSSETGTSSISFATIPNVLPSEEIKGSDYPKFYRAVQTDMEGPVERALDAIGAVPDLIIVADTILGWAVDLGRRRNVRVASFWPAPVTFFLLMQNYHLITTLLAEREGEERIEIPGIPSIRTVADLHQPKTSQRIMEEIAVNLASTTTKAGCILFRSLEELDAPAIPVVKANLSAPAFTIGPAIPYFKTSATDDQPGYISWLDSQLEKSVIYVSLGSFMSTSAAQMIELAEGIRSSGAPFLWSSREKSVDLSAALGDRGMVVPWCDQMRVLRHSSVGGFLTHCGWNSSVEAAFAGVPVLTFPLGFDQLTNELVIVRDWGIGWRVKERAEEVVGSEAISSLLKRFMDLEGSERRELDRASERLRARVLESVREDGSTSEFDSFLSWMEQ